MKKGLLLSIVASTVIFAGGDIAPVEPAAAAPAADCSEFYGVAGIHYRTSDAGANDMFDAENSKMYGTVVIGYEGQIANGLGFGAKLGGRFNLSGDDMIQVTEKAELSRAYFTYSFGNTALKAGRFDLPGSLSPLLYTDSTDGIDEVTYEGILFANTDFADTTVYGAAIFKASDAMTDTRVDLMAGDMAGGYALGFVNKSIANTTITAVGYFVPDNNSAEDTDMAVYGAALTIGSAIDSVNVTGQVAFAGAAYDDAANPLNAGDPDASLQVSLRAATKFGATSFAARAWYTNDGAVSIGPNDLIGQGFGSGREQTGVRFDASTPVASGTLYGRLDFVSYDKVDAAGSDSKLHARLGYKAMVLDNKIELKTEYRYTDLDIDKVDASNCVRLDATYKF